ncbi:MAG: GcrA family cell cycle regulator [Hyphomicrobium sp.]|jgi:hypothetical protein
MSWAALPAREKADLTRPLIEQQGLSYGQAAAILGTTRTAIAGVISRNGLKSINTGVAQAAARARLQHTRRKPAPKPKPPAAPDGDSLLVTDDRPLRERAWDALPGSTPILLHEHTNGCRWPIGRPVAYCNLPVFEDHRYCAEHHKASTRVKSEGGNSATKRC